MALDINLIFQRSSDRTTIVATDLTGAYDATTNTTGYGGVVNPAVADFSTFSITVTPCDPTTLLPTGTAVVIDAWDALPSQSDGTFDITSLAVLGTADTVFIDGVYQFALSAAYSGGAGEGTYTETYYAIFYEIVECCIQNMTIAASGCGCDENDETIRRLVKANMWLGLFQPVVFNGVAGDSPLVACEQWDKAATLLLQLQAICDNDNCSGC